GGVLPIGGGGSGDGWSGGGVQRVGPRHFAKCDGQVLGVAAGLDVARAHVVGVSAVARREVQVSVPGEGDRPAVVVARVLSEGDQLPTGARIHHVGIGGRHLPFRDQVHVVLRRVVGGRIGRPAGGGNGFARVGVERAVPEAGRFVESGVERQPQEAALVVGVGRV